MHKAPELVQLAFNDMEVAPQGKHHRSAVLGRSIQPCTHGIFVHLDDACRRTDRIAFCSCPHRRSKNGRVGMQIQVHCPISDRHRRFASFAPRLFLAVTTAILDQESPQERTPIIPATPVRTVEGLPVHCALLEKGALLHRECNNWQESAKFITAVEGHYRKVRLSQKPPLNEPRGKTAGGDPHV